MTTPAQLRAAAAGVCGFRESPDMKGWWDHGGDFIPYADPSDDLGWTPDTNRDQLARVFVAALEVLRIDALRGDGRGDPMMLLVQEEWQTALTDPRAALVALLDLLRVPVPTNE